MRLHRITSVKSQSEGLRALVLYAASVQDDVRLAAHGAQDAAAAHALNDLLLPLVKGYGSDPNILDPNKPGTLWPLVMTATHRKAAKALADTIIPKDRLGPAASSVGVIEMLDEWVSAPYPKQQADQPVILDGLTWIDGESNKRFSVSFAEVTQEQRHAICDDICFAPEAKGAFKKPAQFFSRFRSLCAGAYYATPAGLDAIGYVGNVPLQQFDGPPAEVLEMLGVTQTVK